VVSFRVPKIFESGVKMRVFQALPHPGLVSKYGSKRSGVCEYFFGPKENPWWVIRKIVSEAGRPLLFLSFRPAPERARPIFGHPQKQEMDNNRIVGKAVRLGFADFRFSFSFSRGTENEIQRSRTRQSQSRFWKSWSKPLRVFGPDYF
jgi:hypothetical protein